MRSDHRLLSALAALILFLGLMLVGGCSQEQPDCPEQMPCQEASRPTA